MSEETSIIEMELRQQNLEKEMCILKDTVWRLTGRIYVLETFLSEKFDELVVDFGLKLSLQAGGQANFLSNAMQASLANRSISEQDDGENDGSHTNIVGGINGCESEEMTEERGENDDSPPPVGANITISPVTMNEESSNLHLSRNQHRQSSQVPCSTRNNATSVSLGLASPGSMGLIAHRDRNNHINNRSTFTASRMFRMKHPDPADTDDRNSADGDHFQSQSDFNVEEFVVFPHVPEFILGQEVQNGIHGSSEGLITGASSESSCSAEEHHHNHENNERSNPESISGSPGIPYNVRRNRQFKCIPCAKLFTSEWHLKAHLVKHADNGLGGTQSAEASPAGSGSGTGSIHTSQAITISPLPIVKQDSSNVSDLQTAKPFACVYCGKRFKKRQELTVHLRTHTGEKPFRCPVCDRGFSQSSSMKTHLRIHTGERPFKCNLCKSSFTVMHNYKKHLQTAHQIEDFAG